MDGVNIYPDGTAVAYPVFARSGSKKRDTSRPPQVDKKRSKRHKKLACAINLMSRGKRDTIFITITCAGLESSLGKLSLLLNLMRNNYGLINYVWVRELTKSGLEHFHLACQFKDGKHSRLYWQGSRKAVQLSEAWSKILGAKSAKNSIRFGWKYINNRATKWYIDEGSARYMTKYLTKSQQATGRKVQLSQTLAEVCKPARYLLADETTIRRNKRQRLYYSTNEQDFLPELAPPHSINDRSLELFRWKVFVTETHFCFTGRIKEPERFKFFSDYIRNQN